MDRRNVAFGFKLSPLPFLSFSFLSLSFRQWHEESWAFDSSRLLEGQAAQYTVRLHYGWMVMGSRLTVLLCIIYATSTQGFPEEERKTHRVTHTHIHPPTLAQPAVAVFVTGRKVYAKMIWGMLPFLRWLMSQVAQSLNTERLWREVMAHTAT